MNTKGATGIATAILLISFILIGATSASLLIGDSGTSSDYNYEEMVEETIDEISTYIQIKDIMGKYSSTTNEQYIQKIAILIKPLFSTNIDASKLIIKMDNGEQIKMLNYNRHAEFIKSHSLFEHPLWNNISVTEYSFITILDTDQSIINFNTINDNTDMTYIVIKLPNEFSMKKGDMLEITFFPSTGITKTINLEAPLPIKPIVSLI